MKRALPEERASFTLVELLVALTIIVALTLIGIPAIGPMISASSVDSTANLLRGALMNSRNSAVAQQLEGVCWLAGGSVIESGTVESVTSISVIVDNDSPSGVTITGSWTRSTLNEGLRYDASYLHDGNTDKGAKSVRFTPTLPRAGSFGVYLWWPHHSNRATNVPVDIFHAGGTDTVVVNQTQPGGDWVQVGTYTFNAGTSGSVLVRTDATDGYVVPDAVLIGTPDGGDAQKDFVAVGKGWGANSWANDYYVVIANLVPGTDSTETVFGKIESNTSDTVTVTQEWKDEDGNPTMVVTGSRFLIHNGNPETQGDDQSLGSGTDVTASWDQVPDGAVISPYDAVVPTRRVFPIVFTNKGRAKFANADGYITFKIYSRDDPTNEAMWRYVRLYANSGRTAAAHTLDDLD